MGHKSETEIEIHAELALAFLSIIELQRYRHISFAGGLVLPLLDYFLMESPNGLSQLPMSLNPVASSVSTIRYEFLKTASALLQTCL